MPSSLPVPATPLIGRTQEIADISALLRGPDTRLVTVVAPGGMGKTHLSLAVAAALLPAFADGVHFVPLAPLSVAEHIPAAILHSLHLPASGEPPHTQLLGYVQDKQLLLVLDNFEHLLLPAPEAAAGGENLVVELLQAAPQLKLLVTSRERLNVRGEAVLVLGGLPLSEGQEIAGGSAAQLFQQHVRLVRPGLVVQENDRAIINHICRLVEGMPLALILAASWVEMLSLAEIAEEVTRSLDFLETDMADVPLRQRSIRAIFDAAWRRLAGDEQAAFRQLAVFRGGFTRQAAQAVTNASLRTLRALLHKLFITMDEKGRYQIHELLRQYGAEKLAAAGGDASARTAHAHYFLELLHRSEADLRGGRSLEALAEIEADFENIRSAWGWALTQRNEDAINRSLEALQIFLEINGRYLEAIALFEQAQHQLTPTDNRAPSAVWGRITARCSFMRLLSTGYADSLDSVIERCQQTAQASGDRFEIAFCLFLRGTYLAYAMQDLDAAAVNLQQAVTIFREIGDDSFAARALITFGIIQYRRGLPEGRLLTEQALKLARKVDDLMAISVVLNNLGEMAFFFSGEYGTAERYTQEALTLRLKRGFDTSYARAMSGLCMILRGQADEAEETLRNSLEEAKAQGHRPIDVCIGLAQSLRHSASRFYLGPSVGRAGSAEPNQ